jgi:hypothetical protein
VREVYVSRAGDPVHAGDKVLAQETPVQRICFWHCIAMSQSTKRRWNSGPSTPSSTSKKKKYNCKFQDEWKIFISAFKAENFMKIR